MSVPIPHRRELTLPGDRVRSGLQTPGQVAIAVPEMIGSIHRSASGAAMRVR